MVELVPAPWTNEFTRSEARKIMCGVGQKPVSMTKELPGFCLNRIQYPVISEAWSLVASGVVSAEDIDVVMKDGLGMRYAICGTMEVVLKISCRFTSVAQAHSLEDFSFRFLFFRVLFPMVFIPCVFVFCVLHSLLFPFPALSIPCVFHSLIFPFPSF